MTEYSMEVKMSTLNDMVFALQLILAHVLSEVARADPKVGAAISEGFEKAAEAAQVLAMKEGNTERGKISSNVLGLVEEFRSIAIGDQGSPGRAV